MRGGALRQLVIVAALGLVGLTGFAAAASGDLLPPLPTTTTVTTPPLPPLPTSTTVPLPPITTATVRLPTTTTVPVPTTTTATVRLPTTSTPLPTTTVGVPVPTTTTATVRVQAPTTTTGASTPTTQARAGAAPAATSGGGSPPASGPAAATGTTARATAARKARTRSPRLISGPALEAVKAGAHPVRHGRARRFSRVLPEIHAARVAARTPGLAAFYAGLEKALTNDTTTAVAGGKTPAFVWPTAASEGGVLSRDGALMLALALVVVALLLGFSLLPRLAAIGFLPVSRTTAQAARESSFVALGAIAVCALLAVLLLRSAL